MLMIHKTTQILVSDMELYFFIRIFIFILILITMIEDIKTKMVSSIFLYAINFLQLISAGFIHNSQYFYIKIFIATLIFILYFLFKKLRNYIGEADVIFICLQIVSMNLKIFIIFWWSYLSFSLIYGIILYIRKSDSYVPMFPSFAFGEIISILVGSIL